MYLTLNEEHVTSDHMMKYDNKRSTTKTTLFNNSRMSLSSRQVGHWSTVRRATTIFNNLFYFRCQTEVSWPYVTLLNKPIYTRQQKYSQCCCCFNQPFANIQQLWIILKCVIILSGHFSKKSYCPTFSGGRVVKLRE